MAHDRPARARSRTAPSLPASVWRDPGFCAALLGRSPAPRPDPLPRYLTGQRVLVTGAGGSIGSELCRQIARAVPERLILLDVCENGVFSLCQELSALPAPTAVEIASVRDRRALDRIFSTHRPQIVFHAAAHKHVPLMERCPAEAVENNIFGTERLADACLRHGAGRMIFVSTDKAVRPASVMGATKRFCELRLQSLQGTGPTDFAAVRFGNVLGSQGSVGPVFLRQIEAGGPVTLTDRRMTRYFMTIPEAVGLLLKAGAMTGGPGVYLLDMGRPVPVLRLAERLIRLAGRLPYREIPIRETGVRPGEKLREQLHGGSGGLLSTSDPAVLLEPPLCLSPEQTGAALQLLEEAVRDGSPARIRRALRQAVPDYHPALLRR